MASGTARSRMRPLLTQMLAPAVVLALFLVGVLANVELNVGVNPQPVPLSRHLTSPSLWSLVLGGGLLTVLLPPLRMLPGALLTLLGATTVLAAGYYELPRPLVPMETSLIALLILYLVHVAQRSAIDSSQKQRVIDAIGQYIPRTLAHQLMMDPNADALRAEARELTVMFCDVRGFSGIAEQLAPQELSELLNAMLTPLTRIVHQHGGTIDKYIGDAIMAMWGAPENDRRHAAHAVSAALEMQRAARALRARFRARGWPALDLGIGINTGIASVGNMGSEFRVYYTAIGDTVNLAARLESLSSVYQTGIIVGESTRAAFSGISYRELGLLEIKGKKEFARVYEPIDPGLHPEDTVLVNMRRHNDALSRYYARDWDGARERFARLQHEYPDDRLYQHYLERIRHYRENPPPEGWRGEVRTAV